MPPIELIEKRTRNSKTHHLGGHKYSWDGTIGSIHYEDNGWQGIDNYFEPAVAPWNWQMLRAGYHIRVKEGFNIGQILEFEKQGETVQFQPMALEWTNDLDMIQQISMPQGVSPVITNPEVDLLPAVGMPSHQGTIRWDDAYGDGLDFQWRCSSTRLIKILEIENLNKLPVPEQYILDGGNPVLRLNLIFAPSKDVDIYVDGEVWDKKARKQTFKIIEFRKDGEVLWGFMPLRYWGSGTGSENRGQSVATLEKRGNKLYISIRVPYGWLQNVIYPVFIDTDVDEQITDNANDGCNYAGTFYTSNILMAGSDSGSDVNAFLRWPSITIEGTIDAANFQVYIYDSAGSPLIKIYGIEQDDPAAPTNATEFDADYTDATSAAVAWNVALAAGWRTSPEIKAIFQELVGSFTISNDAVMLQWRNDGGSGTNYNWADDYSDDNTHGAKLHIEYEAAVAAVELGAFYQRRNPFGLNIQTAGQVRAG